MVVVISFIFGLFGFLLSPTGLFAVLLGIVLFIGLPAIPKVTGKFESFGYLHRRIAGWMIGRFCFVITKQGDLILKKLHPTERGFEKITVDGEEIEVSDPAARFHYWLGAKFALVDGESGVMFDPRDAAQGVRKRQAIERGEFAATPTDDEWEQHSVREWINGVWEFETGVHELVDLTGISQLLDGGEAGNYPKRMEEFYKHHRDPHSDGPSASRLILIIVAMLAPFAMMWFIASQGSTPSDSVSFSVVAALLSKIGIDASEIDIDGKEVGIALGVLLPLPLLFLLFALLISPWFALLFFVSLGIGFWFVPLLAVVTKPSAKLGGWLATQLFNLGLMAYDRPVLNWTPRQYELIEGDKIDKAENPSWYGMGFSLLGITFEPSADSWRDMTIDTNRTDAQAVADGGGVTNIPANYRPAPEMRRGGRAAFVPKRFKEDCYYVHSGIALGKFTDSSNGERTIQRLLWAKDKFGGGSGMSERQLMYTMLVSGFISFAAGLWVWIL